MFDTIILLLNKHFSDNWFLDSGSLLGIIRDKQFLKSDLGIDISILCDSISLKDIEPFIKQVEKEGFITSVYQWEGVPYKYCFVPGKGNQCTYGFDLHLFKRNGDIGYCCPQVTIKKSKSSIRNSFRALRKGNALFHRDSFVGDIKYMIGYMYRYVFRYFGAKMNMSKYAKNGGKLFFWVIPYHMLHGIEKESIHGFNVLIDPDEYLTFRYKNWRIPVSDWVTTRDDGGLLPRSYNDICAFMNKSWN